jgi:hypothetical protein
MGLPMAKPSKPKREVPASSTKDPIERRQWTTIIAASFLTPIGASAAKDFVPFFWSSYVSPLFQKYSLTVYLENRTKERYPSKFRISIIATESRRVIDDGEMSLGEWLHFGKVQNAGQYALQATYSEGISRMIYSKPISISGKDHLTIGFPDQWTYATSDLPSLAEPATITMSDLPKNAPPWMRIALSEEV